MSRQWASGDFGPLRVAAVAWIEQVCSAIAADPPVRLRTVITKVTETGFESKHVTELDAFEAARSARVLGDQAPAFEDLRKAAAARRDVFDQVPAADEHSSPDSVSEQRVWVAASVGEPILTAYLSRVGSVRFDQTIADEILDQVERDLRAPTTPYTAYAPIAHMNVVEAVPIEVVPGVRVRTATTADRERWLDRPFLGPRERTLAMDVRAVLEMNYEEPKDPVVSGRATNRAQELVERVCIALQLQLDCDAYASYVEFHRDAIFGTHWSGIVSPAPRAGRTVGKLGFPDVDAVRKTFDALTTSANVKYCAIALRRWDDVCARARPEDTIVDAWVGLESLLFRGSSTGELTSRASLRLAALIGQAQGERRRLFGEIKKSYDARSKVLHGADTGRLDLPTRAGEARGYLRRALIAILVMPADFQPNAIEPDLLASSGPSIRTNPAQE